MATYRKRGKTWRAEVAKFGIRQSKTFDTKAEATAWATAFEAEILAKKRGRVLRGKTLSQALDKYKEDISPTKAGERWEVVRLEKLKREMECVGDLVDDVTADDIARWRDKRLKVVAPSSVNRELNLLSAVFQIACDEWKWCSRNPVREVKRPKDPRPRDRRITEKEIQAMTEALGFKGNEASATVSQRVAVAFLFALETGMRAGEICGLVAERIHVDRRYCKLDNTKNGDARDVPLSTEAIRLLKLLPGDTSTYFGLSPASLDALWRKARIKAAKTVPSVADLHFHDSRHEAITRLARKLDVLDLARMIGHRDPRSLMIYYNATATDIASRLD